MSSINFPNNPVINDTFTSNGLTYEFDGDKWTSVVDLTASAVEYDPTVSGLIATDVQAAVDEITSDLNNLEQNSISDADSNVTVTDNSKISFVFNNVEEAFINANGLTSNSIVVNGGTSTMRQINPEVNNTYDLGTSDLRWRTIFTQDLELSNGIGDFTIVEGEDDLFIYNNKRGKVYKFVLVEVNSNEATPKMSDLQKRNNADNAD